MKISWDLKSLKNDLLDIFPTQQIFFSIIYLFLIICNKYLLPSKSETIWGLVTWQFWASTCPMMWLFNITLKVIMFYKIFINTFFVHSYVIICNAITIDNFVLTHFFMGHEKIYEYGWSWSTSFGRIQIHLLRECESGSR